MTPDSLRVKLWRESHKAQYNERQKLLMRKKRMDKAIAENRVKIKKEKRAQPRITVNVIPYVEDNG